MGGTNNGRGMTIGRTNGAQTLRPHRRRQAPLCAAATAAVALSLACLPKAPWLPCPSSSRCSRRGHAPQPGQDVLNPLTGQDEVVAQYLANGFVVTDDHNLIILENAVGDMFYFPNESTIQYTVATIKVDATTNDVYQITVTNNSNSNTDTINLVTAGPGQPKDGGNGQRLPGLRRYHGRDLQVRPSARRQGRQGQ